MTCASHGRLEEPIVDTIVRIVDMLEDRAQVEAETQAGARRSFYHGLSQWVLREIALVWGFVSK
jgi:hypothetical protein